MDFFLKISFVKELVTRLHRYGASAGRLESAVSEVSDRLGLKSDILASATGAWLSFEDPKDPQRPITYILRMPPGSIDLGKLGDVDKIAYDVALGKMGAEEGQRALSRLDTEDSKFRKFLTVFCCGLASMGVPTLFSATGYADMGVSFLLGLLTGLMILWGSTHWRVGEAMEALAAFMVTVAAGCITTFALPLSMNVVVVAGLISLMPGLSLTTAIAELSAGQLMTGVARFGGAITTLMKLTFGAVAGVGMCKVLGWNGGASFTWGALDDITRAIGISLGALAFAGLFHAKLRDTLLVAGAVLFGHFANVFGQEQVQGIFGALPVGTFISALLITVLSNLYSTVFHKPGAVIRLPGIIMLVPGSVGFKAGQLLWSNHFEDGASMILVAIGTVVALVAGILIGNLLVAARRKL